MQNSSERLHRYQVAFPLSLTSLFACITLIFCLLLIPDQALAQNSSSKGTSPSSKASKHFDPTSTQWNGTSIFVREARRLGLDVVMPKIWDWSQARVQDPIVLLAPKSIGATPSFVQFALDGGRIFLADDFGDGRRLWRELGLKGSRLPVQPSEWSPKNIDIYSTIPREKEKANFLLRQSTRIFLNIPQWFEAPSTPNAKTLLFARMYHSNLPDSIIGGDVLAKVSLGPGRFVVLSDSSALINQMIVFGDNIRLVRNILLYLTQPLQAKRIVLLWGDVQWKGRYKAAYSFIGHTSLWTWEGIIGLQEAMTSTLALMRAHPPVWNQSSQGKDSPKKKWERKRQKRLAIHHRTLYNKVLIVLIWILLAFVIIIRWMVPVVYRFHFLRKKKLHTTSYLLNEKIESYQSSQDDFLWPAILLREELLLFLDEHLPEVSHRVATQLKELSEQRSSKKKRKREATEALDKLWWRLHLYFQHNQLPDLKQSEWRRLKRLVFQVPDRADSEHLGGHSKGVSSQELTLYYQTTMKCLRIMKLLKEFRAPLSTNSSNNIT